MNGENINELINLAKLSLILQTNLKKRQAQQKKQKNVINYNEQQEVKYC